MESAERSGGVALALGLLLVLGALAMNEAVLAYLFAPDAELSAAMRWRVRGVQAVVFVLGLALMFLRYPIQMYASRIARRFPNSAALAFGLGVVAAILVGVELGFHAWNVVSAREGPQTVVSYSEALWKPGAVCRSRKTVGDRVVYDVTYTMDEMGRRVTPAALDRPASHHLLFFGGSYTFGQGVDDAETFPNTAAENLPDWRVTNFGYPGHGPAHLLERLEDPDFFDAIPGDEIVLVYTFIPNHVRRVIGSMRIATAWGRQSPYYAPGPDGELTRMGVVGSGRARLSEMYRWLSKESILKFFEIDVPVRIAPRHLEHTAAVIAACRSRFLERIENARFVVVIYPDRPEAEFSGSEIAPYLAERGIECFDYAARLERDSDYWIGDDTHPTAEAHARVGAWFAEDLARKLDEDAAKAASRPAAGSS